MSILKQPAIKRLFRALNLNLPDAKPAKMNPRIRDAGTAFTTAAPNQPQTIGKTVAHLLARIEELDRENAALSTQLYTDPMTGLKNIRFLKENLQDEIEHVGHGNSIGAAFIMIDMDGLTDVNTAYGHGGGNAALTAFAKALDSDKGYDEMAFRLHGDEFAYLVDDIDEEGAAKALETIRARIDKIPFDFTDDNGQTHHLHTGGSAGLYYIRPEDASFKHVMDRADAEMYREKEKRHSHQKAVPQTVIVPQKP